MKKFAVVRALGAWDRKRMHAGFWWET